MNEVTYTFSRALHMMRYSGAKMAPIGSIRIYYYVKDNTLYCTEDCEGAMIIEANLISHEIMGSWVEVK